MFKQTPICGRRRVVKLIDNHDVECIWSEPIEIHLGKRLNGRKHVPPLVGSVAVHIQFAKVSGP